MNTTGQCFNISVLNAGIALDNNNEMKKNDQDDVAHDADAVATAAAAAAAAALMMMMMMVTDCDRPQLLKLLTSVRLSDAQQHI